MKLKLIVKLGELILGKAYSEDEPRADMYLPIRLLSFALVLFVGGIAVGVYAVIALSIAAAVAAADASFWGYWLCCAGKTSRSACFRMIPLNTRPFSGTKGNTAFPILPV